VAYVEGLKESILKNKDEVVPYKVLEGAEEDMEKVVEERLKLFNGIK
jgi:fructose/tagatose bisphosphate aldolase